MVDQVKVSHSKRRWSAVALVAVIGTAVGVTTASAAGSGATVIKACANASTGALRLASVKTAPTCNSNEVAVSWNQTGPTGPAGAPGPAGPAATSVIGGSSYSPITPTDFTTNYYLGLSTSNVGTTERAVSQIVPAAGTVTRLTANADADPGCLHLLGVNCIVLGWDVTLLRNGVATAATCTIWGANYIFGTPEQPCDITAGVTYNEGDTIAIAVHAHNTVFSVPNPARLHWTASYSAPAA